MECLSFRWRPYTQQREAEIIQQAQGGDNTATEYLLYRYRNLVRKMVQPYYLVGAEKEDLLQIGMIGLWEAIIGFKPDKQVCFATFARVCIQRHVVSAVKSSMRQQHVPLNHSLSFGYYADAGIDLGDVLPDEQMNIEEQILALEEQVELEREIERRLSDFEQQVLLDYRAGKSYKEIAVSLSCSCKAVDNALVRIKKKMARKKC